MLASRTLRSDARSGRCCEKTTGGHSRALRVASVDVIDVSTSTINRDPGGRWQTGGHEVIVEPLADLEECWKAPLAD